MPQVRGNPRRLNAARPQSGTIPAGAGEPTSTSAPRSPSTDYPRRCGGTVGALQNPGRRPFTEEEIAAEPARAGVGGAPSAPLPGAPGGWQQWRRDGVGRGREREAAELGTIPKCVARRARAAGLDVARGRKITFSRRDLKHAIRTKGARRPIEPADLDRVAGIVAHPQAVLHDLRHGSLVYVGPAADGQRLVKVVIKTSSEPRKLKMGARASQEAVVTNYIRTLRYEDPRSVRRGQVQILAGSLGE